MTIEIILDGTAATISQEELFDLAKQGIVNPATNLLIDGKLVTADRVGGITFISDEEELEIIEAPNPPMEKVNPFVAEPKEASPFTPFDNTNQRSDVGTGTVQTTVSSGGKLFCTNCGKPVANMSVPCRSCGATADGHQKFCKRCGVTINPEQVICTKCNTETAIMRVRRGTGMALIPLLLLLGAAMYNFATSNWVLAIVCVVAAFIVNAIDEKF